jgi:hypothetical protein
MDETRAQSYLQLIQTLLTCPNGEHNQILNANLELVDAELVEMMVIVAVQLSKNKLENEANSLFQTATQIANFLGMNDDGDRDSSESEDSQEYALFIERLLSAEHHSKNNIKVIYPILTASQYLLNARFAEILQELVQKLIAENPEAIKSVIVDIVNLSVHISNFPLGSRANNLEIAITGYQIFLSNSEPGTEQWAMAQINLAAAYKDRINGSRVQNLERAIGFYDAALTVLTCEDFPEKWAITQHHLANAYSNRINGSPTGSTAPERRNLPAATPRHLRP